MAIGRDMRRVDRGTTWGIFHFSIFRSERCSWIRRIKDKKFCMKRGFRHMVVRYDCSSNKRMRFSWFSYFLLFLIE